MAFWRGLNVRDTADIGYVVSALFVEEESIAIQGYDDWIIFGEPLLWQKKDKTAALINERYFSDFTIVDLTSLNEQITVGKVELELLREWPANKITKFLLSTCLLRTFIHTHSELRLIELVQGGIHRERYEACHFMYTNVEVRTKYRFQLTIDTQSGAIDVAPW